MAFCVKCGSQIRAEVRFCEKCGTPTDSAGAAQQPAPQVSGLPAAVGKKGISPLIWILGGLAVFLVLIMLAVAGTGFFIAKKVHDSGLDTGLMQKNPVLAAAKMAVAVNPDVELVKVDEDKGLLSIREKSTGKVITINAEDVKSGKISFTEESSGEKVSFGGGAGGKLPDWVPAYPGSTPEGAFSATTKGAEGGMAHFKTSDSVAKVIGFYQDALKESGYKITAATTTSGENGEGGMVSAEDEANNRTVVALVSIADGNTQVVLNYGIKK